MRVRVQFEPQGPVDRRLLGWDLEVLIAPGGREIVVVGQWVPFAETPSGRGPRREAA